MKKMMKTKISRSPRGAATPHSNPSKRTSSTPHSNPSKRASSTNTICSMNCHNEIMINRNELMSNMTALIQDLKSTSKEALGMFLWILGAPQSVRQAEDRFERLLETVSNMFSKVLKSVVKLAADIIKSEDPQFREIHPSREP
jgi:hypothetical protein